MRQIVLLCALLVVCGKASGKTLVIIGDSLTEGYGVAREKAYPALLESRLKSAGKDWRVVNSGISGSTSASAASRVAWALKQKPEFLLLALGANDGLRGLDVKAMESNLEKAIQQGQQAKVRVALAGMQMPPNFGAEYTKAYAAVFPRLAKKHGVVFVPFLLERVAGRPELNQADGIHPNEKGHALIAETVFKSLESQL